MRRQWFAYIAVCGAMSGLLVSGGCFDKRPEVKSVNLRTATIVESPSRGWLDDVSLNGGKVVARGWAMNGETRGLPDTVIIANQKRDVLAIQAPFAPRPDVANALKIAVLEKSGFLVAIDPALVVATGTTAISAYAYSAWDNKAFLQTRTFSVATEGGKVSKIEPMK